MPCNHLILCHPLLLLSSIFPSIRVFSNESALCMRWSKYWSFSISPTIEYPGLISFRMDWLDLAVQGTLKSLLQHHSSKASIVWCSAFFIVQLSHPYMTTGRGPLYRCVCDSNSCLVVVKTKRYFICSWFSFLSSSSDPPIFHLMETVFHYFSLPLLICHPRTSPGWAEKQGVLVHSGNYNKTPQTAGFRNNRMFSSKFWRPEVWNQGAIMVGWGPLPSGRLLVFS